MPINLTITAESVAEFDALLARFAPQDEMTSPAVAPAAEAEAPLTKRGRPAKKTDAEPVAEVTPAPEEQATAASSARTVSSQPQPPMPEPSDASSDAEPDQHPMLKEFSLQDVKDAGSRAISRSPKNAAAIKENLEKLFDSKTFGGVKAGDYARCVAMLEDL